MTVQQVEQPDRAYPNGVPTDIPLRRRPKVGDRFGELTVIKYIGIRRRDRCRLWLLRCDCGRTALRTTGALNQSVRDHHTACCRECFQEIRAGRWAEFQERKRFFWRDYWDSFGLLYSPAQTETLERRIRADFEKEFGPLEEEEITFPVECWPADDSPFGGETFAMTYAQIAEEIGVAPGSVQKIAERAIGNMYRALRPILADPPVHMHIKTIEDYKSPLLHEWERIEILEQRRLALEEKARLEAEKKKQDELERQEYHRVREENQRRWREQQQREFEERARQDALRRAQYPDARGLDGFPKYQPAPINMHGFFDTSRGFQVRQSMNFQGVWVVTIDGKAVTFEEGRVLPGLQKMSSQNELFVLSQGSHRVNRYLQKVWSANAYHMRDVWSESHPMENQEYLLLGLTAEPR